MAEAGFERIQTVCMSRLPGLRQGVPMRQVGRLQRGMLRARRATRRLLQPEGDLPRLQRNRASRLQFFRQPGIKRRRRRSGGSSAHQRRDQGGQENDQPHRKPVQPGPAPGKNLTQRTAHRSLPAQQPHYATVPSRYDEKLHTGPPVAVSEPTARCLQAPHPEAPKKSQGQKGNAGATISRKTSLFKQIDI